MLNDELEDDFQVGSIDKRDSNFTPQYLTDHHKHCRVLWHHQPLKSLYLILTYLHC
jgi:hypothetical protein